MIIEEAPHPRRTWAEIDLAALRSNFALAKSWAGSGSSVAAVIKADAYGHGIGPVAGALADRAAFLAVATVEEAALIHEVATQGTAKILILGPCLPEEARPVAARGWRPCLSTLEEISAFRDAARELGRVAPVHFVADTGMGRMGALERDFPALVAAARAMPELAVEGLASHLPCADEDAAFTAEQLRRFDRLVEGLTWNGPPPFLHVLNSAGLARFRPHLPALVRPGLMLYGVAPEPEFQGGLRPVMRWKTRVRLVRELPAGHGVSYGRTFVTRRPTKVATLGVGYGDGLFRAVSGKGAAVLIGGVRRLVLGRVTMDQTMVDVSAEPEARPGDEAVLLGSQGNETLTARDWAAWAGTIPWEIFTSLTSRVPRIYGEGESCPAEPRR